MKKKMIPLAFVGAALLLLSHWFALVIAFRKGTIFAYQNYWGAPQEKYTLLIILVGATITFFILLWRQFHPMSVEKKLSDEDSDDLIPISQRLYAGYSERHSRKKKPTTKNLNIQYLSKKYDDPTWSDKKPDSS